MFVNAMFAGGGTVIVNKDTLFVSFIVDSRSTLPHIKVFPREIMAWSEHFYKPVFADLCGHEVDFRLEDTDYVFDQVGCARSIFFPCNKYEA